VIRVGSSTLRLAALVALSGASPAVAAPAGAVVRDAAALIERAGCRECHNPEGVANDTRLVFPEAGAPDKQVQEFAEDLLELVNPDDPEKSRLIRKPTKRMEHAGGQKVAPGSADEAVLRALVLTLVKTPDPRVAREVLGPGGRAHVVTGLPAIRRLTGAQYDNTVRDLLGDVSGPSRHFPPEDFVDGFRNQVAGQGTSPILIEAYNAAAVQLADSAARSIRTGDPRKLLPCKPTVRGAAALACGERFVRELGRRAFRRPLSQAEIDRISALLAREARGRDLLAGVRVAIETFLQSPSFLYLRETSDPKLKPFARASRLAYFLWNTMPDDALLDAAAAGELGTPEGLEAVARRMIESPKAKGALDAFVGEWLRFDQVLGTFKDRRAFPQFSREVAAAMTEETRRFIADLVWNDRNFLEIFTGRYSFVNAELAALYGLPAPAGDFEKVAFPASSPRAGVLTHGSLLAGTSKPLETAPTARGLFMREHFLCQKVPPPPPGVDMNLPPLAGDKPMTNRQRMAMHLSSESCASCHRLIDTIGYGFEKFDAIGRYQETLKLRPPRGARGAAAVAEDGDGEARSQVELPLDTRGSILGIAQSDFETPRQMGEILARSLPGQQCVAKQVFRYATGRLEGPGDRAIIERAFESFKRSGFKLKELLVSIAKWTEFGFPQS
jgi:hypothetical protein